MTALLLLLTALRYELHIVKRMVYFVQRDVSTLGHGYGYPQTQWTLRLG